MVIILFHLEMKTKYIISQIFLILGFGNTSLMVHGGQQLSGPTNMNMSLPAAASIDDSRQGMRETFEHKL